MEGRTLLIFGGVAFPPKSQNTISHTKANDIAPTMAAAATLLWKPSDAFPPTILRPTMSLYTSFQDIPLHNFYCDWFSVCDRQPVALDSSMPTALDTIIRW